LDKNSNGTMAETLNSANGGREIARMDDGVVEREGHSTGSPSGGSVNGSTTRNGTFATIN